MTCSRCYGLVVEDRFKDWTARWRCMECGHVQNLVNEENHLAGKEKCLVRKSDEPDYQDEDVQLGLESFIGPDGKPRTEIVGRNRSGIESRNLQDLVTTVRIVQRRVKWRTAAK